MRFLVKRCVRNQVIFCVIGLALAVLLAYALVKVLKYQPDVGAPRIAKGVVRSEPGVEKRKDDIAEYLASKYRQNTKVVRRFVDLAWLEAEKHPDVQPELILAVIQKESSLIPEAKSSYGAQGLMQVVRRWHPEKLEKHESLYDPKVNIRVGAQILQEYINMKGQLDKALVKYSGNASGYADFVLREKEVLQSI